MALGLADDALISIHALLAESDRDMVASTGSTQISIHALLAESDPRLPVAALSQNISIHALLAESDAEFINDVLADVTFLSTLSLRRATAKVHKTVGHFCAYETNFMGIASSC